MISARVGFMARAPRVGERVGWPWVEGPFRLGGAGDRNELANGAEVAPLAVLPDAYLDINSTGQAEPKVETGTSRRSDPGVPR